MINHLSRESNKYIQMLFPNSRGKQHWPPILYVTYNTRLEKNCDDEDEERKKCASSHDLVAENFFFFAIRINKNFILCYIIEMRRRRMLRGPSRKPRGPRKRTQHFGSDEATFTSHKLLHLPPLSLNWKKNAKYFFYFLFFSSWFWNKFILYYIVFGKN